MACSRSRSFISMLAAVALSAFSATATVVTNVYGHVAATFGWAFEVARDFLSEAVAKFERPVLRLVARPVDLVQACAYALKLAKRERPRVQDQWRMCPSI